MTDKSAAIAAAIQGREIDLALDLDRVLVAKEKSDVDIGSLEPSAPINTIFADTESLGRTVFALYTDRLEAAGLKTDREFFRAFDGEARRSFDAGMRAAIIDFFSWGAAMVNQIAGSLEKLPERLAKLSEEASGPTSTNAPESSDSPETNSDDTPSDN